MKEVILLIVKFRPVTKIRKTINGKRVQVFNPRVVYEGELHHDKTLTGYSHHVDKHIDIGGQ